MSGIAGIARAREHEVAAETLLRMAASLQHRGPDGYGVFIDRSAGLAHVRLATLAGGGVPQPMIGARGRLVVVHDGAVYNHAQLRRELQALGHRFDTQSDTEVLVRAFEQWGEAMLQRLDGPFAFAVYDRLHRAVFMARDRFGARPLFMARAGDALIFASEAKALLASGEVHATPDLSGLDEAFTLLGARAPRTPFTGVAQLEPGSYALWRDGRLRTTRYHDLSFAESELEPIGALATLGTLLQESVEQVAIAYGGVGVDANGSFENGIIHALASRSAPTVAPFRITADGVQGMLSADEPQDCDAPSVLRIGLHDIASAFRRAVWHAETPLLRTEPAVKYLLAAHAREYGTRVLLSGDGAAEAFLGNDLFKETAIRLFCLRQPLSRARPMLLDRVYPCMPSRGRAGEFWHRWLLRASDATEPLFSHMPRFLLASRIKDFYSSETRVALAGADPLAELRQALPAAFATWSALSRAAYLETTTCTAPYLLSAQGERMAFAHGVEVRSPFLNHRLFEFAAALPTGSRLRGLHGHDILRRWAAAALPSAARQRQKWACRSDVTPFFAPGRPEYVDEFLSPDGVARVGIFDPRAVAGLVRRCRLGRAVGLGETQALLAILSTQLWFQEFVASPYRPEPLPMAGADVVLMQRTDTGGGDHHRSPSHDAPRSADPHPGIHHSEFFVHAR